MAEKQVVKTEFDQTMDAMVFGTITLVAIIVTWFSLASFMPSGTAFFFTLVLGFLCTNHWFASKPKLKKLGTYTIGFVIGFNLMMISGGIGHVAEAPAAGWLIGIGLYVGSVILTWGVVTGRVDLKEAARMPTKT